MKKSENITSAGYGLLVGLLFLLSISFAIATPEGGVLNAISNTTRSPVAGSMLNISGGYIATINISATVQNPRWKAFVGNVTGSFTLDDASGSTIFNWALTSISGEVYATRNSSTISWNNLACATRDELEIENARMNHTNSDDNITATFTKQASNHVSFFAAASSIAEDTCFNVHNYVNNITSGTTFTEITLFESTGSNVVYASILEPTHAIGFDGQRYDFEMIVPENGAQGFTGATAYYLYVELS